LAKETQAGARFSGQSCGQTRIRSFRPLPIERLGTYIRDAGLSGYGDKLPM